MTIECPHCKKKIEIGEYVISCYCCNCGKVIQARTDPRGKWAKFAANHPKAAEDLYNFIKLLWGLFFIWGIALIVIALSLLIRWICGT